MYKLLSHTDLDRVGCGILAKLAFGDRIKIVIILLHHLTVKWNGF